MIFQKEQSDNMQQVQEHLEFLFEPEITEDTKDENMKLFDSFHPITKCGKQAYLYCSQQNCKQDASICLPSCSSCCQRHPQCIQTKISSNLHKKIQNRLIQLDSDDKKILNQIQSKREKMTDSISDMADLLKKQFTIFGLNQTDLNITYQLFRNYGNSQKEQQLIQIIKNSLNSNVTNQTICGDVMKRIYDTFPNSQKNWFESSLKNFKSIVLKYKKIVMSYFQDIQQCLYNIHVKKSQTISISNYFANSKIVKNTQIIPAGLFASNNASVLNIQKYLSTAKLQKSSFQKIYSFSYSADQYLNFQKNKFVELVQDKNDLLFLIKNKHKKNFGFFTPLKFNASNEGWIKDENKQTFLFSLDYNCCEKIIYPAYTLKYSIKQNKIFIGGQPEMGQNLKKNSLQICMSQNPLAHIDLSGQQLKPSGNIFGNSSIGFKELNGYDLQAVLKSQQINNLQIYQLRRFQNNFKM